MQEEERQRQEVIKAKAVLSAPKAVGKIDLGPKKPIVVSETPKVEEKAIAPEAKKAALKQTKTVTEPVAEGKPVLKDKPADAPKPVVETKVEATEEKVVVEKTETPNTCQNEAPAAEAGEEAGKRKSKTQYQKLTGYFYRSKN